MDLRNLLSDGGLISQYMPGYEYRPQQLEAGLAVKKALSAKRHCLIEAGTGVGKSMAYLLPAIEHARQGKKVVISTHTLYLQAQLIGKDIPFLQDIIPGAKFNAVLMKGRGNYLCLNNFDAELGQLHLLDDRSTAMIQRWALETETGDMSELDFRFSGWSDICSNLDTCRRQECRWFNKCFYYKMRKAASEADLVVTNHSLFFSDLGIRMSDPNAGILPDYDAVIFDEAHHLEEVATKVFGVEYGSYRIPMFLNKLRRQRGIGLSSQRLDAIEETSARLFDMFSHAHKQEFFFTDVQNPEGLKVAVEMATSIGTMLDGVVQELVSQDTEGKPELADRVEGLKRMSIRMKDDLLLLFDGPSEGFFRWGERSAAGRSENCFLRYSPLSVSEILRDLLWNCVDSAILTSATLSDSGKFGYMKARLGMPDCDERVEDSPFDFARQCLLYVPKHLEFPSDSPLYADKVADEIEGLVRASDGRAFLLFTSYRMMNAVHDRLLGRLPYKILRQGDMSNELLVREFLGEEKSCLFGVHSFWEGVDVRGEALSCVVIDKLPFASPDSAMQRARVDSIKKAGGDWFTDYSMPQAQIRLKQGFGRLIRTAKDRGVVAILDSRLAKKRYGRDFMQALPRCAVTCDIGKVQAFFSQDCVKP
jgi:ATP-dependent DNA helicase DinG